MLLPEPELSFPPPSVVEPVFVELVFSALEPLPVEALPPFPLLSVT